MLWFRGQTIVLVGFAGVGKSTIGRMLAAHLDWKWVDMDELLESYYGVEIGRAWPILSRAGTWDRLKAESFVMHHLPLREGVISTGASSPCTPYSFFRLWLRGALIWLQADPATLCNRLTASLHLSGVIRWSGFPHEKNTLNIIQQKLAARSRYYSLADVKIRTDEATPEQVVEEIRKHARLRTIWSDYRGT